MHPRQLTAGLLVIVSLVLAALLLGSLSGCSTTVPIGLEGRWGSISARYDPPPRWDASRPPDYLRRHADATFAKSNLLPNVK